VRVVFQLIREDLVVWLGRKGKIDNRLHSSQMPYSTTSMLSELTQNSYVPMKINEKDLIALFIELICYKKKKKRGNKNVEQ